MHVILRTRCWSSPASPSRFTTPIATACARSPSRHRIRPRWRPGRRPG